MPGTYGVDNWPAPELCMFTTALVLCGAATYQVSKNKNGEDDDVFLACFKKYVIKASKLGPFWVKIIVLVTKPGLQECKEE